MKTITYTFNDPPSIKDAIEAVGIPHPEVGAITKNNDVSNFSDRLYDGDILNIFPHKTDASNSNRTGFHFKPKGKIEFLLDVHLCALARHLRMAGFSCIHDNRDVGDAALAEFSAQENLILLTRDIGLLKRANIKYARWVRNVNPEEQFREIINHYDLGEYFQPFTLCTLCNGTLESVEKDKITSNVPKGVLESYSDFKQCLSCKQIYWKGSHHEKVQRMQEKFRKR